jgi:hypothetical protein
MDPLTVFLIVGAARGIMFALNQGEKNNKSSSSAQSKVVKNTQPSTLDKKVLKNKDGTGIKLEAVDNLLSSKLNK